MDISVGSMASQNTNDTLGSTYSTGRKNASRVRTQSPRLPSVNERLGYLRPSRELLEYYRKKIAEYDDEHEALAAKLEQYKSTYEEQHKIQWEIRQREEEISELQKALSDMQVYLFQEREHVLRLYAENDRLKLQELEDRKKIHTLLTLSGLTEREVSYFLKEPPAKAIVPQHIPEKWKNNKEKEAADRGKKSSSAGGKKKETPAASEEEQKALRDNETLTLQVEALQAQLEEHTRLAKEQETALLEDRRVRMEEQDMREARDQEKIKTLQEKLQKTQDLLYDSTRDYLALRYEGRAQERQWMAQKDRLLRELDNCRSKLDLPKDDYVEVKDAYLETQQKDEEIKVLASQHKQTQKLADMYREQVIQLEDELARIREEDQVGKDMFKDRSEKMAKRLQIMNQRYTELEKRRNLEVAGFKVDIKNLRAKLKDLEKQLFKVTLGLNEDLDLTKKPDEVDMLILRNVRRTAGRSKKLMDELKTLKGKVYGMENDLKHL